LKRLLFPLLAALAGIATLALLFPRFDPSAGLGAVLARDQAIAQTRKLASRDGLDTAGWQVNAVEALDTPTGPVRIRVALIAPGGKRNLQAAWFPNGTMAVSRLPDAAPVPDPATGRAVSRNAGGRNVNVHAGRDDSRRSKLTYVASQILDAAWRAAVLVYFCVAAIRRRVRYRLALILTAVLVAGVAAGFWGGTGYQKTRIFREEIGSAISDSGDADLDFSGAADANQPSRAGSIFWLFVFAAAGYSLRAAGNREKWSSLELAVRGSPFSRPVGWSIAAGLLSGIGIAAIPYCIAASGWAAGGRLVFRSVELLAAPFPTAAAWDLAAGVLAVGLFGFSFPLVAKLRQPALRWGLFAAIGIAAVGGSMTPFSGPRANLIVAVALCGAYLLLYLKTDLLATMTAMVAAQAALAPCLLLSQPGGSVRALAVAPLLVWGLALAASLNFAIRGREGDELPARASEMDPALDSDTKSGRMRLEAEFEVARKAQQDALPTAPPELQGYSLAGSCQPAHQVGGDLYDFFPLPDGRLGIAVADVSGKGIPAALYMMVTKGLLAAVTRDSSDLAYILQQINLHLYRACKKRVFVTLAAVALDPAARRLQHGRAGHNPILWRRTARGETVILKPPGLGLGMTPGERFNRSLRIEELELQPGDAIVLYSDGITEAVDSTMQQFGDARLIRAVEAADGQPAEESRVAILRDLAAFVGATPARDDVTLVVLRVAGNGVLT
jgi:serine phosphatase RsbU (regulator of sigma subunit)